MNEALLAEIKEKYANSRQDSIEMFKSLLVLAKDIGLEEALSGLENFVFERRSKWIETHPDLLRSSGDPVLQAYHMFYERYLGLSLPRDGEVVESSEKKFTVRWHNRCPTLEACVRLGLETGVVCRLAYERPVQSMIEKIDPRLRFVRNYHALRPDVDYCEESIELVEN